MLVEEMASGTGKCHRTLELHGQAVDVSNCIYHNYVLIKNLRKLWLQKEVLKRT